MKKIKGDNILTIGCDYDPPKGGIAQVLYTYSKEVYEQFNFIPNSCEGDKWKKLLIAIKAFVQCIFVFTFRKEITIIHIHTASYISFKRSAIFLRLAKMFGKKVILHIHGGGFKDYFQTHPNWILKTLQRADAILTLTEGWKSFFQVDLNLHNVEVIPNIIPRPVIIDCGKKDGRVHLLFLGAINEQKGIFDLLSVVSSHKKDWKGKLLIHIGGNQEVNRLKKYIVSHNIEDLVVYEGWVYGEKKMELLNMMDAYILPSYVEGFPLSILESLSYGKPVITTPVGGIPEVVNENNGFLFPPGSHEGIFRIINTIINNRCFLIEKSKNAKSSVEDHFPKNIAKKLIIVYGIVLH